VDQVLREDFSDLEARNELYWRSFDSQACDFILKSQMASRYKGYEGQGVGLLRNGKVGVGTQYYDSNQNYIRKGG